MITAEDVRENFAYNPLTGILYRTTGWTKGKPITTSDKRGYIKVSFKNRKYLAHRLIWLWLTGEYPKGEIDHINRDTKDNSISNLRDVCHATNMINRVSRGVSLVKSTGRWRAFIRVDSKQVNLGCYDTETEALLARQKYETENQRKQAMQEQADKACA